MELDARPGARIVIVPDVHDEHAKAERILEKEAPDTAVFLGDYFDSFEGGDPEETARWLAGSMEKEGRVHLLGNHDVHYMSPNREFRCSGYDEATLEQIRAARVPWQRAVPYCWLDGRWLCTHAGLSGALVRRCSGAAGKAGASEALSGAYAQMESALKGGSAPLFEAGRSRGGLREVGGITWCDYSEFEDVAGVSQVFGHTKDYGVRSGKTADSEHHCIDTALRHYAVYEGGAVSVKEA